MDSWRSVSFSLRAVRSALLTVRQRRSIFLAWLGYDLHFHAFTSARLCALKPTLSRVSFCLPLVSFARTVATGSSLCASVRLEWTLSRTLVYLRLVSLLVNRPLLCRVETSLFFVEFTSRFLGFFRQLNFFFPSVRRNTSLETRYNPSLGRAPICGIPGKDRVEITD